MRKFVPLIASIFLIICIFISCKNDPIYKTAHLRALTGEEKDEEGYDGPAQRDSLNFLKIKDPVLGYVPSPRIFTAIDITESQKNSFVSTQTAASLTWTERGPIFDTVGPSNGNIRGGGRGIPETYTSGRMRGVLIDTLNDATGNTVFVGGVAGGLWKCTNFLSTNATWVAINDRFENLAVSSICQDPTNPAIMYFSTGEPTSNADAVFGGGIWKSTNSGSTWSRLTSTVNFIRNFKIQCDAAGNVYLAARVTTFPVAQPFGLQRSNDKGATWTNITPLGLTSINETCTDFEITKNGKLHASFGYSTSATSTINYRFTTTPATVTSATWLAGVGIRLTNAPACRFEIAAIVDTLYGVTINPATLDVDSCYKSINGGVTWATQNPAAYPSGLTNGQGWYNLTLAINPANTAEFLVGGLDAYRSINSGQTITRQTFWVGAGPYVHADHHFMQWRILGGESRIIIGCDGGIFISRDGGGSWSDRNKTLGIKQFYSGSIHPAAGSSYLLAGAQDNGVHQIKTPGLTSSVEVTGGDGAFTHINQKDASVQFGSFVFNNYRRSVDGGQTWSRVDFGNNGLFINPWDYDDTKNILYGSWAAGTIIRWANANTSTGASTIIFPELGAGTAASMPTAFKVSLNTVDRVFIGASRFNDANQVTKVIRVDNASTAAPTVTDITSPLFPATAFLNCVNTGLTDQNLVVVFSNFGINNVWHSSNGGTTWTAIDGNLPDMPVRWAVFVPGNDNQLMIATETGIFTTDLINGSSTIWSADQFPTVRTDMLKLRISDNGVVAATHGRGLFTAAFPILAVPVITFATPSTSVTEDSTIVVGCRRYRDYTVNLGINNPPAGDATVTFTVQAGNTAVQGVDFDITTNGNFTTPSSQVVFTGGATTGKSVTVRIYDDAEVESTETFTLGFSISGNTNAVAGGAQTHTFTILDNDPLPDPAKIATALNTSRVEHLTSNNDLYYYGPGRNVIARIKNLSAQNYGCTQVTIDRAGTGVNQFWNFNPANYLMNKTFQVVPTTNSTTGKYDITFYYTKEEKEGWEAATGQSWNNIMLIKVPSRISNVTPLNAQPDGPGTVQILTPVRGTFGTGYTLTATVDNGFSGFGAGVPGRINTILTLSGQIDANLRDINLSWTTSAEMGSVSFEIEKSFDGISFRRIGTVAAAGTKLTPSTYTFVDNEYLQVNYYRVKLIFSDGTFQYSNIIFIKNDNVPQRIDVLGNPFSNNLIVRLSRVPTGPVDIRLFDMSGRLLLKYTEASGATLFNLNTTSVASAGIYKLRVFADNQEFNFTVLK